jgi:molecular chaperone DnaK (HSP70)
MNLGIDFGTTRTVVACADRGNYPIMAFSDEDGDTHDFIPSVVAEHEGKLYFGWAAIARPEGATLRSFKRLLADGRGDVRLGSIVIPLEDLVTRFLAATRDAIAEAEGVDDLGDVRSVVAVPANASGLQRFVTLDSFRRAGLGPVAMLNEPSAAGFEYTHRHRDTLTSKRDHVVVYDLGGGTFDASLVRMRGRTHEVLATAGRNKLGGDDFDDVLLDLVLAKAGTSRDAMDARVIERLRAQCRDAKERLGPSSRKIAVELEDSREMVIPVAEFYEGCKPLVDASIEAMVPVMTQLEDATKDDVERALAEIAGIYVVGGASELPIVARALRERFGRRVHRSPYPSAAIAIGLAIACDESAGFELSDRFSRTFGVFREGDDGADVTFDPIFTQATELPARFRRTYRAAHNVGHFRFLECSNTSDDGRPRGDMLLSGDVLFPFDPSLQREETDLASVPVSRLPGKGPLVEEEYALDENGIVGVTIKDLDAGFVRAFRLGA